MQWNRFRRAGGESCHRYPSAAPPTYKSARQLTELANFPSVVSTSPDRSMGRQFAELANVKQLASSGSSSESRFVATVSLARTESPRSELARVELANSCLQSQLEWSDAGWHSDHAQASTRSTADTQTASMTRREAKQRSNKFHLMPSAQ